MQIKEIKRTRTIEEVIRTEYIADDGEVFYNENECKKYEESARFVLSKKVKRILRCNTNDLNYEASDEYDSEIFNVETQEDLGNLKRYLYLTIKNDFSSYEWEQLEESMKEVTFGHEVIIHWHYDHDGFYICGDGSIEDYGKHFMNLVTNAIKREQEKKENE